MQGGVTPELTQARQEHVPTFTHFLDIPMLLLIVSLGAMKPSTWTQFIIGAIAAVAMATILTLWIPRLYPWVPTELYKSAATRRIRVVDRCILSKSKCTLFIPSFAGQGGLLGMRCPVRTVD